MTLPAIVRSLFSPFIALALSACAPTIAAADPEPVQIRLSRSACYGFCPAYSVTISGDGEVRYVGERFVHVLGEARASIPRADVERLLARFDAIGFEELADEYSAQVSDHPTYIVELTRNGRRKRVRDYAGAGAGMPASVRALQEEIDRVAGTARWVLREGEPVHERPER